MANVNTLSEREKDMLIQTFAHFMDMDMRYRILREMPVIYAKMYGQCIEVKVKDGITQTINFSGTV